MQPEEKYAAEIAGLSDREKPIVIALAQFQNSEAVDRTCPFCGNLLNAEGKGAKGDNYFSSWSITCKCDKSNTTFRGL
jgi:hypothetical protein